MRPHLALIALAAPLSLIACRDDSGLTPLRNERPLAVLPSAAPVPSGSSAPVASAAPVPCPVRPACDAPPPPSGAPRPFKHQRSRLAALAKPRHRGRDLFAYPGGAQWVIAKFAYGPQDKDLEDEEIDVHLLRGCGGAWEKVGTYRTSKGDGPHPTVEGIKDTSGRITVDLAKAPIEGGPARPLEAGRHRVHLVVAGDGSSTDLFLEVLAPGARVAVTDIDGTLTSSEAAVLSELAGKAPPAAHPGAAETMKALADSGYYLFYLTARPEWLVDNTRAWLSLRGFPPGILHSTMGVTGAIYSVAAEFKGAELAWLKSSVGLVPEFAFGNMPSDVQTYSHAGIPASHCYYYALAGDPRGGVRHDDYRTIAASLAGLPVGCP